jgi:hypothetical protein
MRIQASLGPSAKEECRKLAHHARKHHSCRSLLAARLPGQQGGPGAPSPPPQTVIHQHLTQHPMGQPGITHSTAQRRAAAQHGTAQCGAPATSISGFCSMAMSG